MKCAQVQDLLDEYFEGTLAEPLRRQLDAHLEQCQACAAELAQITRVASALAAVPQAEPSQDLPGLISSRVAQLPSLSARRTLLPGWRRLTLISAASVAVLAGVLYLSRFMFQTTPSPFQSLVAWLGTQALALKGCTSAAFRVAGTLWEALRSFADALGLAGMAAAPTVALYAALEVALLLATVLLLSRARQRGLARLTLLL